MYNTIITLYSIGENPIGEQCGVRKCEEKKCMCIDSEETGLLYSIIFPVKDKWEIKTDLPYCLQTMGEETIHDLTCKQMEHVIYGKYLFKRNWEESSEVIDKMNIFGEYSNGRIPKSNILEAIPIIKMCNARNSINERYPLFYLLCFHRNIAHVFIYKYLVAFMRKIVSDWPIENWDDYFNTIELFFEKLEDINLNREKIMKHLDHYFDYYKDKLRDSLPVFNFILSLNQNEMTVEEDNYLVNILPEKYMQKNFIQLIKLLKSILKVMGKSEYLFKFEKSSKIFSDKSLLCVYDTYDKLNDALHILYGREECYKKRGMDEFAKLLKRYHEWSDEDIDSFCNYVKNIDV